MYVGNTLLGWSMQHFWNVTPAHLLKQYIMHLRANNPDLFAGIDIETGKQKKYFLDQTPFM